MTVAEPPHLLLGKGVLSDEHFCSDQVMLDKLPWELWPALCEQPGCSAESQLQLAVH